MKKTVQFDGQQVEVDTSAGWFYEYLEQFGHDIMPDIMPIIESVMLAAVDVLQESGGTFTEKDIMKALDSDALVDAFIKLSGMQYLTILNIFWAMAKNYNAGIPEPKKFYKQLGAFPADTMIPALLRMIIDSSVSSKNAKSLLEKIDRWTAKMGKKSTSTPSQLLVSTGGLQ